MEKEASESLKYFEAWLNLSSTLNPQWRDSSLGENFIQKSNKEICDLYYNLFLNLKSKLKNSVNGNDGCLDDGYKAHVPFKLQRNSILGRHLVSKRKIKAGEVLLIENHLARGPIVYYPYDKETPSCVQCYSETCTYLCPKCGFYLCRSKICKKYHMYQLECRYLSRIGLINSQEHIHNLEEKDFREIIMKRPKEEWKDCCKTISDAYVKFIKDQKKNILNYYPAIPTLKLLCLLEKCKSLEGIILSLQGNINPGSQRYKVNQKHIVNVIKLMNLSYTQEFVHKMAAIWDTNAFQSEEKDRKFQVIFALSSLFTHSCKPNCENIFMKGHQIMVFRAAEDIPKESLLTISYTDPFWPTYIRRDHLEVSKNFTCGCERCLDLTECGTFPGHSFCESCQQFSVCGTISKEHCNYLVCTNCNYQINSAKFFIAEAAACNLLCNFKVYDLKTYEEVVVRLSSTFRNRYHDNHHIFQRIRLSLFLEHSIPDLSVISNDDLQKLLNLILELLKFCSAVLPRLSRRRAEVCKEFLRYVEETSSRGVQLPLAFKEIEAIKEDCNLALSW